MRHKLKTQITGLTLASLTILAGCASTSDLEALRADVQKANETASRAASDAAAAQRDAAAAKDAAEAARDTAQDTNEKLDRMFKKSMYK
ncbi:MAG: Lpp/OprI family alanine-zipper lipoprotein [Halioglobus sp.]|jgi:murein lipoprotein